MVRLRIPSAPSPWILLYRVQADPAKGRKLADFIHWALRSGSADAEALDYAPLPAPLVVRVEKALDGLSFGKGS